MNIRKYQSEDCSEITQLFYHTVHSINAKDYTQEQLNVWVTAIVDKAAWDKSLTQNYTVVCEHDGMIVGFGDINNTGYLDKIFVHKDYQGIGIATAIVHNLEDYAIEHGVVLITTHASITAKPFFEKQGYKVIKEQQVERDKQMLTNFVMEKIF
ncbi:GNAT family N-acetyltransferase [Clostridium sp. AWRP]|uniref:GNAT family N-acetyltransferase n=1 Tax=Clostridium sp. AWRP TaxID=2212991 RepID=UPI000FDC0905|nr:GNAT family N-acetyltransferase [Clostridium sp. AWRP]AZV55390.1 GNAT family N-acetyltransferase [Clostridium sp. AWRP]